jgi:O-antigen/teichoic acid export membrane protein
LLKRDLQGLSLRANFSWTFFGNAVYAGTQWALVLLMAKLFEPEVFGRFALALSVVTPIFVASGLQLRAVMVSDAQKSTPFARYLSLRLVTSFLALLILVLVGILGNFSPQLFWMVLFLGLGQAAIMIKDIFQGAMQRKERMDLAAISLVLQGALTLIIVVALYRLFHNAEVITAGMAAGRLLVLGLYDIPCSLALSRPDALLIPFRHFLKSGHFSDLFSLARLAFPLGVVTLLISLNANIPLFSGRHDGESAVGFCRAG